ncbi:MAG: hypothetical protein JNL21_39920 [Myxococcales bacterium]|nr:hypothetical protein [Myxococcales bacterium]
MSERHAHMNATEVGIVEGELIDPEDVPLGEVVDIARRVELTFDGRLSSEQTVPLATGIDSSDWVSAVLVVIIHSFNTWATSDTTLQVDVQAIDLVSDEPQLVFEGASVSLVKIFGDQVGPAMFCEQVSLSPGKIRVVARWLQGDVEASDVQRAVVSIQLVGRRHVPPLYHVV